MILSNIIHFVPLLLGRYACDSHFIRINFFKSVLAEVSLVLLEELYVTGCQERSCGTA